MGSVMSAIFYRRRAAASIAHGLQPDQAVADAQPGGQPRAERDQPDRRPGGGSGGEPYSLPADIEFVFILAGRLDITVGGEPLTLEQGDAYTFPASAPHTFRASPAAGLTRVLWVFSPGLPGPRPDDG
jgi:Cupin domain